MIEIVGVLSFGGGVFVCVCVRVSVLLLYCILVTLLKILRFCKQPVNRLQQHRNLCNK